MPHLTKLMLLLLDMGCIAIEKKREETLSPSDYRLIWSKCLKLQAVQVHSKATSFHPVFVQIDKDVDRTYPDVPQFNQPEVKEAFRRVLRCFALQFPKVGYTQGLNFVAGIFLISGFNEKEALKSLIALCTNDNLMLLGLFQDDFPLCRLYCELFWLILKNTNPEAYHVLKKSGLPDQMWIFQWFITLFTYSLPQSYLKEVFNFIIVKGLFAAVRIAVGILQSLQKYLKVADMKEESLIECLEYMKNQEFCYKFLPIENIIKRAQKIKNNLVFGCLQQCKTNCFYKYYFLCVSTFREKKHSRYLEDLDVERKRYEAEHDLSNKTRYSRDMSSVNIIDSIEESKIKRYSRVMSRSSRDKGNQFLSNITCKKFNSVDVIERD